MIKTLRPKDLYRLLLKEDGVSFKLLSDGTPDRDTTDECEFVLDLNEADPLVAKIATISAGHFEVTISDGRVD